MGMGTRWAVQARASGIKLLGHQHTTHKLHMLTRGSNEKEKAQASAWAQPMATTIPQVHAPQHQQQHTQNSDAMDVD